MKLIILFLSLICSLNLFSQSKKKQIQILTNRIDSLNNVLLKAEKSISDKGDKIDNLEKRITKKDLEITNLKNEILFKSEELSSNKKNTEELLRKKNEKIDSLSELLVQQIENRNKIINPNPYRIDYSTFNKPAKNKNDGIEEWLEQFTLISTNKIELLDKEVSDHYGGSSDSDIDTYGIVQIKTDMYKEGIDISKIQWAAH
jgi:chromosome segregation ATPase